MKSAVETINTKELRTSLARVIARVRRGVSFLVLHRSRPAFQNVLATAQHVLLPPLEHDTVYQAEALSRSKDGLRASEHDRLLYRR